ncbi:aminotransferase A [Fonticella tunisiensis]|uniref:Aminotransferase n=1 Tax=Fonticella tunisiensis TaxID=1096341 RepID=A0A4R7KPK6_9CLOT|nr:aminotransferase A [Fonticella tunisiensis]TDT61070.1 aminotransferase [Fonticella tunisiensis]
MEEMLNEDVRGIKISGIRKFYNMIANYKDAISLTIGQPDFPTPDHIKEAAKKAIDGNKTIYTHNAGLIELRKAAGNFLYNKYKLSYNPEDEIIVTNGASEAIDIALRTILNKGDEVILPGPVYPGYEPIIKLCGSIPVHIDTRDNGFRLNAELIGKVITDKTKCIVLPYPSNPTGRAMDRNVLEDIALLLRDKNIFILSDEIYSELVYEGEHCSIASFPWMREKTVVINGLSKSHSMTGWRIGFTFAPAYITKHMLKVHQYNSTCASSISQYAALEALTNGISDSKAMRDEYKRRRDYVYDRLVSMGFEVERPEGAFYIFPSIQKFGMKSLDFALNLLEKCGVAVVPGDAFSEYGEGYVRISYAYSMEVLKEALDRIEGFVSLV